MTSSKEHLIFRLVILFRSFSWFLSVMGHLVLEKLPQADDWRHPTNHTARIYTLHAHGRISGTGRVGYQSSRSDHDSDVGAQ